MKGYILSEEDFKAGFQIISEKPGVVLAVKKNENKKRHVRESDSESSENDTRRSDRPAVREPRAPKSKSKGNKFKEIRKRLEEKRRKLEFSE